MAIEHIIDSLTSDNQATTAGSMLSRCFSLEGRITHADAIAALSASERYACDRLMLVDRGASKDDGNFTMAFRPHGRVYLLPRSEYAAHAADLALVRHFEMTASETKKFHDLRADETARLEADRERLCLGRDADAFRKIASDVARIASHMAPLILYCGPITISNFYSVGTSTFEHELTLDQACAHVADRGKDSRIEVLTVLCCLALLLSSGPYARLEEFNSCQLTLDLVEAAFDLKQATYLDALAEGATGAPGTATLEERASWLRSARERVVSRRRFIRLINGASLRKAEMILADDAAAGTDLPDAHEVVTRSMLRLFPDRRPPSIDDLFGIEPPAGSPFTTYLEALIDDIVKCAVAVTASDFGMTRGVRDFQAFFVSHMRGDAETACGWGQDRYFCHVAASEDRKAASGKGELLANLNAMSARMRYNTWHYVPSYFPEDRVPARRGWFYAPRMADIADHSDQHHTGHKHAAVKFSIRSPLPITMGQTLLPGFIDLRLMRQTGRPYTLATIACAIRYTEALQVIYQHVMDAAVGLDAHVPTFSFGNKASFDKIHAIATPPNAIALTRVVGLAPALIADLAHNAEEIGPQP